MATKRHLVVIGGVASGMSAAAQARRMDADMRLTVFERGDWISYSACGLPYFVGGLVPDAKKLIARTVTDFAHQDIDVRLRHTVTAIDPQKKEVHGEVDGEPFTQSYDVLMLATGARPRALGIPGSTSKGIFNLYTMHDALSINAFISTRKPKKVVVVGGGYIGLEAAENLVERGLQVSVVQRTTHPFPNLDPELAQVVTDALKRHGVDLSLGDTAVKTCGTQHGYITCLETEYHTIEADLVLVAVGIEPNSELAAAAGAQLGVAHAVRVNERQQTTLPDVYAAGDCAEHRHRVTGKPAWVALGTTANKQGRIAGTNIAGGNAIFKGIVGTALSRVFDVEVGRTGLSTRDAKQAGLDACEITINSTDMAGYYPGAAKLIVKMVAERGTGRLLGVQAVGKGVDKRIDVAATALHAGMTIDELAWIDLGYAPPFNSVWDPLHVAANKLMREL